MAIVLFDGVAYGMLLFLIGVGLSITMGLMNFVNLAHGAFAMVGGYAASLAMQHAGLGFFAALAVAFVAAADSVGPISMVPARCRTVCWMRAVRSPLRSGLPASATCRQNSVANRWSLEEKYV